MARSAFDRLRTDPRQRRWLAFAALAGTYVLVSIYRLSTAVLADELTRAFSLTGTQLGTLHASFFYVYAALQLPTGVLADRLGARRTVTIGTLVMSLGGLVFAGSDVYWLAFAGRMLIGLGGSVLFIAILRFCANWFRPNEFARMSGITVAISGIGGILATTPLAVAVAAVGWRSTLAGLSVVGIGLAVLAYVIARDSPTAAGLDSVGGVDPPQSTSLRTVLSNARTVLGEVETWLCGAVLFAGTGINITVVGLWGVPYLVQTHGLSVTAASTYTLLGSAGLLVGPPVVGTVSDRLAARGTGGSKTAGSRTKLIVVGMAVYAAAFSLLAILSVPPTAIIGIVFFSSGALAGAYALTYAVVKERHDASASGVSTASINMMAFSGAAILPTVMGFALDTYWTGETIGGARVYTAFGYRVAFGVAAAVAFGSFLAAVALHRRTRK